MRERDKYFNNWVGAPTRFIKLNNLTNFIGGAQIWSKVVSDANGGAHKIYNATVHCLLAKRSGKKSNLWRYRRRICRQNAKYGCKEIWTKM